MSNELWRMGAFALAGLIAARAVSSEEVVDAHLERIAEVNPHVNAIGEVLIESARASAKDADAAIRRGEPSGPLHGVPITVKANIDVVGSATTHGTPAFVGRLPAADSPVVSKLRGAGAVPIGRTTMPEMAIKGTSESWLTGVTRNPWHPGLTAGGSSSGEASAIATGMSPLGVGNDIGGSLRSPASNCGIVSLKPSAGLVPRYVSIPDSRTTLSAQLMLTDGPMARTVDDLRRALAIMAGRHPLDPHSVPTFEPEPVPSTRPLRVAVLDAPPGGRTDPRISRQVRRAAALLEQQGYEISTSQPPRFTEVLTAFQHLSGADVLAELDGLAPFLSPESLSLVRSQLSGYPADPLLALRSAVAARADLMRAWSEWFRQVDILLTPTWTQLPFPHGYEIEHGAEFDELARTVVVANLLGIPSACVSSGLVDGLPVGVLVHADRYRDAWTLHVAEDIERGMGSLTPVEPVLSAG